MTQTAPHTLPDPGNACCIGVTGHRPNGLAHADMPVLRVRIRSLLSRLRLLADHVCAAGSPVSPGSSPVSWIITPLAEGADRILAEEGLATGYSLYCPLPFSRREYEKDFEDAESKRVFGDLLSKAIAVQEMGGKSPTEKRDIAYARVGQEVLKRSNVLTAIWDGAAPKGVGGTAQIVDTARDMGIPVIWVHAYRPHDVRLLPRVGRHRSDTQARLYKKLSQILECKPL